MKAATAKTATGKTAVGFQNILFATDFSDAAERRSLLLKRLQNTTRRNWSPCTYTHLLLTP